MRRLLGLLLLAAFIPAPAYADNKTPGYVTRDEFRATTLGTPMARVHRQWGPDGTLRAWWSDNGHRYHIRTYRNELGYGSRVEATSRRWVPGGRFHLIDLRWCIYLDTARTGSKTSPISPLWDCFDHPWP